MMIILSISVINFAEEVTLRFAWWGGQVRAERTLKVIELFEEKYPNVKIEPEFLGWGEYWQKLSIQAAGKNLPDLIQQEVKYIGKYEEEGLLLNLSPYVEDNRLNLTDVDEIVFTMGTYNKKLYGVSLGGNAASFIYDPELFKKAGVEEPTPDWTWEDFIEKSKKIHKALGIYAGDFNDLMFNNIMGFSIYLRQHGAKLYDDSFKKLGYEDDSLFVNFFTMFVDLTKGGVIAPPEVSLEINQSAFGDYLITKKEGAMMTLSSNMNIALTMAAERPLSFALFPNTKDQVQYGLYLRPSMYLVVAENCKYPEWAVKFIDFFTNDIEANKILLADRGVPISSKVREGLIPYLGDLEIQTFDYLDLVAKHSSPFQYYFPPANDMVLDSLILIVGRMLYFEITPEKAAKEFRETTNKLLAE